jgi:hypothetical protein
MSQPHDEYTPALGEAILTSRRLVWDRLAREPAYRQRCADIASRLGMAADRHGIPRPHPAEIPAALWRALDDPLLQQVFEDAWLEHVHLAQAAYRAGAEAERLGAGRDAGDESLFWSRVYAALADRAEAPS